jgi:hypothetical protein
MTNFEMIKNQDIYAMALSLMCPFEAGFLDDYRCKKDHNGVRDGERGKCVLEWLQEESE